MITPTLLWPEESSVIEEAAGEQLQIAHAHVFGIDAENQDVALLAAAHADAVHQRHRGRCRHDAGNLLANRRTSSMVMGSGVESMRFDPPWYSAEIILVPMDCS